MSGNRVGTEPRSDDTRLRGRTYAIPFDRVWNAALALAGGKLRGWKVVSEDDLEGAIVAEQRALFSRRTRDVTILVGLDEDGQTRVDLTAAVRGRGGRRGSTRRIARFTRALDKQLGVRRG